jgi:hypothetical protein
MNAVINIENYPDCCQMVSDSPFWVKDKKHETAVICDNADYDVEVRHAENEVAFLPIDGCVYPSGGSEKRCDFAVAGKNQTFFVEVKELERYDDHDRRKKTRNAAKKQLINTIVNFKSKYQELNLRNTTAVIALLPKLEPRISLGVKSISDQNKINEFFELSGCPNIYEGNLIEIN